MITRLSPALIYCGFSDFYRLADGNITLVCPDILLLIAQPTGLF